jgi:hypothetical protein
MSTLSSAICLKGRLVVLVPPALANASTMSPFLAPLATFHPTEPGNFGAVLNVDQLGFRVGRTTSPVLGVANRPTLIARLTPV